MKTKYVSPSFFLLIILLLAPKDLQAADPEADQTWRAFCALNESHSISEVLNKARKAFLLALKNIKSRIRKLNLKPRVVKKTLKSLKKKSIAALKLALNELEIEQEHRNTLIHEMEKECDILISSFQLGASYVSDGKKQLKGWKLKGLKLCKNGLKKAKTWWTAHSNE